MKKHSADPRTSTKLPTAKVCLVIYRLQLLYSRIPVKARDLQLLQDAVTAEHRRLRAIEAQRQWVRPSSYHPSLKPTQAATHPRSRRAR